MTILGELDVAVVSEKRRTRNDYKYEIKHLNSRDRR